MFFDLCSLENTRYGPPGISWHTPCRLILQESLRHRGNEWLEYNRTFRKQAAISTQPLRGMHWSQPSTLLPSLANAAVPAPFAHSARGQIMPLPIAHWHLFNCLRRPSPHCSNNGQPLSGAQSPSSAYVYHEINDTAPNQERVHTSTSVLRVRRPIRHGIVY